MTKQRKKFTSSYTEDAPNVYLIEVPPVLPTSENTKNSV